MASNRDSAGSQAQAPDEANAGSQAQVVLGCDAADVRESGREVANLQAQVAGELVAGLQTQAVGEGIADAQVAAVTGCDLAGEPTVACSPITDGSATPASLQPVADRLFPVAERFISVNGEGRAAGKLAAFIRFTGCNLTCSYCDTMWANAPAAADRAERASAADLVAWVRETRVECVTLTGGEPALQPELPCLVRALLAELGPLERGLRVEIETNGATDLHELARLRDECASLPGHLTLTVDWKLPSSGMEGRMLRENFTLLDARDTVKFVCGGEGDLDRMLEVSRELGLPNRVPVYLSPVFGRLDPARIVDFMQENNLTWATVQLQLHKIIWPGVEKGV